MVFSRELGRSLSLYPCSPLVKHRTGMMMSGWAEVTRRIEIGYLQRYWFNK